MSRRKSSALRAGFDMVLFKPVALVEIKAILASVAAASAGSSAQLLKPPATLGAVRRLPIGEARRIRTERNSKNLTQAESEAAICDGIIRFQQEYLGWISEEIQIHLIKDLIVIRIQGC